MQVLVDQIKRLEEQHPVRGFHWEIPTPCPLPIPKSLTDNFKRNVYLKQNFARLLSNISNLDNHYWIIREWGKIRSFKRDVKGKNDARIIKFTSELAKGRLTRKSFDVIASLSKVASFSNAAQYAIYDSRAVYTLNWLLHKWDRSRPLFPQPLGRNADISQLDQRTIFSLSGRGVTYVSHKTAYHEYCTLLRQLAEAVHGKGKPPYLVEMLLFRIAPTWTINDMKKSISLTIADSY